MYFCCKLCDYPTISDLSMPRKLNLAYKKHGSVKPKPQDVSEEGYLSGAAHSSNQTDQASETMSTQTDSVDTCDVPIQTDKKDICNVSSQTDKKDTSNVSSQTDKKDTCDVAIQTAKEQPSDQPNLLTPLPFSATVKVDIDLFYSLGIVNINQLQRRLSCMKCIYGNWFLVPARLEADKLQIVRLSQQQLQYSFVVEVFEDLKWSLQLPIQQLSPSTSLVLKHLPEAVTSVFVLRSVLMFLDQCTICQGNPDPKFAPIVAHSKGIFKDRNGKSLSVKCIDACNNISSFTYQFYMLQV